MGGSRNGLELLAEEQAKSIRDRWGQKQLSLSRAPVPWDGCLSLPADSLGSGVGIRVVCCPGTAGLSHWPRASDTLVTSRLA